MIHTVYLVIPEATDVKAGCAFSGQNSFLNGQLDIDM